MYAKKSINAVDVLEIRIYIINNETIQATVIVMAAVLMLVAD